MRKRLTSLLLILAMLLGMLGAVPAMAADTWDGAAFGELSPAQADNQVTKIWTYDAMDAETLKALVNSQELHPQRTGWMELDQLLGDMVKQGGDDAYSQLWYMYSWLTKRVYYSWAGYRNTYASVAAYNSFYYNYLKDLTYEDGLQKAMPDDMANRTYHVLTARQGVCYDYAIALVVIARYIGLESFVRTGHFVMEYSGGNGHHGWALLRMDGKDYVFDPQRDARNYDYNGRNWDYFGIAPENAWRYETDWWNADIEANQQRDSEMLSPSADRAHKVTVSLQAVGSGTASGQGSYITGNQATVTAVPAAGHGFAGWYDAQGNRVSTDAKYTFTVTDDTTLTARFSAAVEVIASRSGSVEGAGYYEPGQTAVLTATLREGQGFTGWYDSYGNCLSTEPEYTVTVTKPVQLYALFAGDVFCDVKAGDWYLDAAIAAHARGLVNGTTDVTFEGSLTFNRAMAVALLERVDGLSGEQHEVTLEDILDGEFQWAYAHGFEDVADTDWFSGSVYWAVWNHVTNGTSETTFSPMDAVTRQDFITMVVRYLEARGYELEAQELTYTDAADIADYAVPALEKAHSIDLIKGYGDGTFKPRNTLTRAEGVTIIMRLVDYLERSETPEIPAE